VLNSLADVNSNLAALNASSPPLSHVKRHFEIKTIHSRYLGILKLAVTALNHHAEQPDAAR